MEPLRWQAIQRLFDAAIELPAGERAAFVAREAAQDIALAREVSGLLAAYEDDPEYLESALTDRGGQSVPPDAPADPTGIDPLLGARVGVWRIVARLGEGGMGVVYRAERVDGAFEQNVAIKVVRRGLDTEHLLRRFASERRILAALDHPDIARPVDAGVLPDGRPYLAMEYVEGERIDEYCAQNRLGARARIDLFLAVCDAVDHAHRRLVIHRDLKPANILVTREGRVKLLDFGVAKLLDPQDPLAASTLTTADLRPLTPDYASPEQLGGEPVTTAADVYALGVLLFELLTGRRPFDRASRPRAEWIAARDEEPPRPSACTQAAQPAELAGDLDAVVLAALHPDPERRYDSPRALAEDLRRHRDGLPVRAREDSALYRARRFVGRHRIGVGIALGFALVIVASGALLVRQVGISARERARAEREQAAAERVVEVLVDLFRHSNPEEVVGSDDVPVGSFLARAAKNVDELEDQPDVQIRVWLALAAIHGARSRYESADSVLARAAGRLDDLGSEDGELHIHVDSMRGKIWRTMGRFDEARETFRRTYESVRALHGTEHRDYVIALQDYASLLESGQERRALLEECVRIAERVAPNDPVALAAPLNELAVDLFHSHEFERSAAVFARAERIVVSNFGETHPHSMSVRFNLASVRSRAGDHVGAETTFRQLLDSRIRVLGERSLPVAATHSGLGIALSMQDRHEEALSHFREAAGLTEELLGDAHPRAALEWMNVGRSHEIQSQWTEALDSYARAQAIAVRAHGESSAESGRYLSLGIAALLATDRVPEARDRARRAVELVEASGQAPEPNHIDVHLAAARTLRDPAERELRGEYLRRSHQTCARLLTAGDPQISASACALAVHLFETGDAEGARALLDEHLERLETWPLRIPGDAERARAVADRLRAGAAQR